jgi:hypothetical protein
MEEVILGGWRESYIVDVDRKPGERIHPDDRTGAPIPGPGSTGTTHIAIRGFLTGLLVEFCAPIELYTNMLICKLRSLNEMAGLGPQLRNCLR